MTSNLTREERVALVLGLLGFVFGPVVGVFAVLYSVRRLRDIRTTRTWPYRVSICLAGVGLAAFLVSALMCIDAVTC